MLGAFDVEWMDHVDDVDAKVECLRPFGGDRNDRIRGVGAIETHDGGPEPIRPVGPAVPADEHHRAVGLTDDILGDATEDRPPQ